MGMGMLEMMIEPAVRLRMIEMSEGGGPTDADFARLHKTARLLGECGDVLLYGGSKKMDGNVVTAAVVFNALAHAVAVMSFCPGGVELFGVKYESRA